MSAATIARLKITLDDVKPVVLRRVTPLYPEVARRIVDRFARIILRGGAAIFAMPDEGPQPAILMVEHRQINHQQHRS